MCGVQSTNLSTGAVIWMCLFWLGKSSSVWSHGAHHGLVAWVPDGGASTTTELELWPAGEGGGKNGLDSSSNCIIARISNRT